MKHLDSPHRTSTVWYAVIVAAVVLASSCSKGGDIVNDGNDQDSPPARVGDLTVAQVDSLSVTLQWTAPACGSPASTVNSYDLRYAAAAIDSATWDQAIEIDGETPPLPVGSLHTMVVTALPFDTTVFFALRTCSTTGLWSEISNSPSAHLPPPGRVVFADSTFEAVIREIVQQPDGVLRASDLVGVVEVEASNRGIHSLEGLQYCINLARLGISGNNIASLGPVAGLNRLSDLDASRNDIADLLPLAGLRLMNLSLGDNAIHDIDSLQNMEFLNVLVLDDNQIGEITPLAGCVRLNHLFLSRNQIADLTPLTGLIYLSNLGLEANSITELAALVANTGLDTGTEIWLAGNPLSETARNVQIPELRARGAIVHAP